MRYHGRGFLGDESGPSSGAVIRGSSNNSGNIQSDHCSTKNLRFEGTGYRFVSTFTFHIDIDTLVQYRNEGIDYRLLLIDLRGQVVSIQVLHAKGRGFTPSRFSF